MSHESAWTRGALAALAMAMACAGAQGPEGPVGPAGPAGPQGPAGTFSGTFTGDITVTGNAAIAGNVTAANLLTTEAFTGWLTNSSDFTAPAGTTPILLKFTDVKQNTNGAVFRMELDGTLTILKPGVVNVLATFDATGPNNYVGGRMNLNGALIALSLAPANGTNWGQVTIQSNYKVAANDAITVLAAPSDITLMDNGGWSRLSVQWTGVP